ncbi:MAG TPA: MFS transporter [Acidimicrobiales bacterium]|nr:MFS transporter [Acidimicrobiales bacterium]
MAEAFLSDDERAGAAGDEPPTVPSPRTGDDVVEAVHEGFSTARLFGSPSFFRLWLAQVASSLGDWIGFVAITALAARIGGGGSPEAAVGVVLSARLVPGFFLAPVAGVFVDRWDRKKVMVACDIGRGMVLATLPWVDTIAGLVFASLLLEILTLLWSPAKEASVPKLVPKDYLPTANSLSLVAAYGTFPIGSALFAATAGFAKFLGGYDALAGLSVDQEFVALYLDVFTFFVSAALISTLVLPHVRRAGVEAGKRVDLGQAVRDVREGLSVIGHDRLIRSVMLAIATGLIGGGMLVPLGPRFAKETLGGGSAAFGLLLTALGGGMAAGIITLSIVQRKLPHQRVFVASVLGAGLSILIGASMSDLPTALFFVTFLGVFAGAIYVLGFTILQTNVDDELRGRVFATLYTLVRFCLLLAFAIAPFLSSLLDGLSNRFFDRRVELLGIGISVPGTRLTLWLGGLIILGAGALALVTLRDRQPRPAA